MLRQAASGFGGVTLLALMGDKAFGGALNGNAQKVINSLAPRQPHFKPRARDIIFLSMDGGRSQMNTFDPKPRLTKELGQPVSDLFPFVGECADDLCVIRSMVSNFSEHTNANYFLHTGLGLVGRPSMGAWTSYGLGSENQNLPGFVVLNGGLIPPGGLRTSAVAFFRRRFKALYRKILAN